MADDKRGQLEALKKKLEDLKKRRPEHCAGTEEFVGVNKMSPELIGEIEELEDQVEALEKELGEK
jgi:archaellum component FlaC